MKILTAIAILGIIIWYFNFMSPEKKRKRRDKFDAFTKSYEERIAQSKEDSFKKGEATGRTISKIFMRNMKNQLNTI